MTSGILSKSYEPKEVEKQWYAYWESKKLFAADEKKSAPAYSIVIPPPNVTGVLHMGHALNNTIQDILCRYKKMQGYNVLWMPGTDHAGIATQNVVERHLASEGLDRHKLGREEFVRRVWEWRAQYGGAIIQQLKRLGASCDWERERFTMDKGLSRAVRKVFVELYRQGLIYRSHYIINWCPRCLTALADLEVEYEDQDGCLYHIRYPFEGREGSIVVATTRPESMLGDTAVAVNPDDARYAGLENASVILPIVKRSIPLIYDEYVQKDFGTGALKITPAHDVNDFEIGKRHQLQMIKVIGDDGKMNENAGKFASMDRFECRKAVVEQLEREGFLVKIEPYRHGIGRCYRCKTIVEPNLSEQWFVKAKPLAEKALDAVRTGKTRIIPDVWTKTYYDWLENIKDWCISRQIWWGHQIPAWTCDSCGKMIVSEEDPASCPFCNSKNIVQETDVLDTWFSSALWPFSTMGWPDQTELLSTFYPTSVLVTGFDILFFWVARMMMMGLHFMGDVPFRDVYIHALVRDAEGKKMSKSKGNVIDPIYIIDKYGTDAFRFTLTILAAQGRDIKLSEERIDGYRHFMNKLWNASRFSLINLEGIPDATLARPETSTYLPDRWILSRLSQVTGSVIKALDDYKFNEAAAALYQFVWHEFCDWYIECIKPVLYDNESDQHKESTRHTLRTALDAIVRLLHPFTPFITEEIWQKLHCPNSSIMEARFPGIHTERIDPGAEKAMQCLMELIAGIRNIRYEMNIPPSQPLDVFVQSLDESIRTTISDYSNIVKKLARVNALSITSHDVPPQSSATGLIGNITIHIPLKGVIDFAEEERRLQKEIQKADKELAFLEQKLSNKGFVDKAPSDVVEKVRADKQALSDKREALVRHLKKIEDIM
ncbi:MAG: valine--tRNA ligase [Pseudomonadota bacterium]